jgi:hypothetical protein
MTPAPKDNRNDTVEYWRARATVAEQKILAFHAQLAAPKGGMREALTDILMHCEAEMGCAMTVDRIAAIKRIFETAVTELVESTRREALEQAAEFVNHWELPQYPTVMWRGREFSNNNVAQQLSEICTAIRTLASPDAAREGGV